MKHNICLYNYVNLCLGIVCLLLYTTHTLQAQTASTPTSFADIGFSARGLALGNSLTADHGKIIYGYYNPAYSSFLFSKKKLQTELSTMIMDYNQSLYSANVSLPLPPTAGLNLFLLYNTITDIDGRDINGFPTQALTTNDIQLGLSFGLQISSQIASGVAIRYSRSQLHTDIPSANSLSFDIGLLYRPHPRWIFGITGQHFLGKFSWFSSSLYGTNQETQINDSFPLRIKTGVSYLYLQKKDAAINFEVEWREVDKDTPSENNQRATQQFYRIGNRYSIVPSFQILSGQQITFSQNNSIKITWSFGFHLKFPNNKKLPHIEYTWVKFPYQLGHAHVFSFIFSP